MPVNRVRHIPIVQDLARIQTGAVQFGDDWPGLFIRGDNAKAMAFWIRRLGVLLADYPNSDVADAVGQLKGLAEIIEQDVIVH